MDLHFFTAVVLKAVRLTAVVLMLVWGVVAQAQQQNKPAQFLQLTITTVRGSAVNDYEEFVKKVNAARDKTPGSPAHPSISVRVS